MLPVKLPASSSPAFPRLCSFPTPTRWRGPVTPKTSCRAAPAKALKGQQGPGAHSPSHFEANPTHIVLDGTLPGLPEERRSAASMPSACWIQSPSSDSACYSKQVMNEGGYRQEAGFRPWCSLEGHKRNFTMSKPRCCPFEGAVQDGLGGFHSKWQENTHSYGTIQEKKPPKTLEKYFLV